MISVILPTHAPNAHRLARTLDGLRLQTWPRECWELLIIDNASPDPDIFKAHDLTWQARTRIIREERLGLTYARLAGIKASQGEILVFVDDDNVLEAHYLLETAQIFSHHPELGAIGGKALPEWETAPENWVHEFASCLALRDWGDEGRLSDASRQEKAYPEFAPVGAGMALRREAALRYAEIVSSQKSNAVSDRSGGNLSSGGDNDIVLTLAESGWKVGYFPQLRLTHLIPASRLTRSYLARLNHGIARSWVEVLSRHGIRPWPRISSWTIPLRKFRAFWRYRPWRDAASYVRWRGACGNLEGRASLSPES
ncbi:MAG: glycosyltransferase [Gemmataceae bacterium]